MLQPGVCPICGSENVSYGDSEIQDSGLRYEFHCDNCSLDAWEWYELEYTGIFDANGNEL